MRSHYLQYVLTLYIIAVDLVTAGKGHDRNGKSQRPETQKYSRDENQSGRCPASKPFVHCVISPCKAKRLLGSHCQAHPQATCVNELCGGCVAKHFVDDREVHCGKDTNVICELHNSSLSCPTNHVMSIRSANYGRTDSYTCRHSYNFDAMHNNTRCYSNATQLVARLCEGQTVCWPDVSSKVFGDPCHGIYKYLKVDFDCIPLSSYFSQLKSTTESADDMIQQDSLVNYYTMASNASICSLAWNLAVVMFSLNFYSLAACFMSIS